MIAKILLLLWLLLCSSSLIGQQVIVVSTMDVEKDHQTLLIEKILHEAYDRIGIELQVIRYPIKRSLVVADSGEVDGELYRMHGIGKKYTNLVQVPEKIYNMQIVVLSFEERLSIFSWEELEPFRVGYLKGFLYVEERLKGYTTVPFDNISQGLSLLNQNRLDYLIGSRVTSAINIRLQNYTGIHLHNPFLDNVPLFHYLHSRHRDLVPRISASLLEMHQTGEIERIISQFIKEYGAEAAEK